MLYSKISPVLEEGTPELIRRLVLFDPKEVYAQIKIKPYDRHQSLSMQQMFPNLDPGYCACGCGSKLTGRQTRWYSEKCQKFPLGVFYIIRGDLQYINGLMRYYLPHECSLCHCKPYLIEKNSADGIQVDHILAVGNGGGGAWLGNYRFLCHRCHGKKTAEDNKQRTNPVKMIGNQVILF